MFHMREIEEQANLALAEIPQGLTNSRVPSHFDPGPLHSHEASGSASRAGRSATGEPAQSRQAAPSKLKPGIHSAGPLPSISITRSPRRQLVGWVSWKRLTEPSAMRSVYSKILRACGAKVGR